MWQTVIINELCAALSHILIKEIKEIFDEFFSLFAKQIHL